MYDPSLTPSEQEEIRNARIRRLRADRLATDRRRSFRRLQPLALLAWIGGAIGLTVLVLFLAVHFWRIRKDGGISGPL